MGVWHFLSLGESPGAVTAVLAYIKHRFEQDDADFFGGDSNRHQIKKTSGIVIFTTPEVRYRNLLARDRVYVDNLYKQTRGTEYSLNDGQGNIATIDVVTRFISHELGAMLNEEQGSIYWLEANYHDLDFNLLQIARAFYVLSPPNKTGREVWVNLTGGSNVMNLATLLVTVMSGITGRAYYTYTKDIRLLRPANENDFWYDVPVLKLNFDKDYEAVLQVLHESDDWMDSDELFGRVMQRHWQFSAEKDTFAKNYLNKLDGWLIERRNNQNRLLRPAGKKFLDLMQNEVMRALIFKEELNVPIQLTDVLEEIRK